MSALIVDWLTDRALGLGLTPLLAGLAMFIVLGLLMVGRP